MKQSFTAGGLVAVGVLMLVGASGTEPADPADVLRQLGVPDSIADRWTEPYIPLWALTQEAPVVGLEDPVGAFTSSASPDCPPSLEMNVVAGSGPNRFDSARQVTELYDLDHVNGWITRYDFAADLSYTTTVIPAPLAAPHIAADLDADGDIELVSQYFDKLKIHSAPDGALLATFEWVGMSVVMEPVAVNIDDDPHLEIYVTPLDLGFNARVVVIDYNPVTESYEKTVDFSPPFGAVGYPAVGDFDQDGRMEFISGTYDYGYRLYEWQESTLVYIGLVGDSLGSMNYNAVACRPKPGGVLHALLGHSGGAAGYYYQLLEPTGDNTFDVVYVFQEVTGGLGAHPCWAADTDCDGLDELAVHLWPIPDRIWEWDVDSADFFYRCEWDHSLYGSFVTMRDIDLDQNGAREWATTEEFSYSSVFRVFPGPECVDCDTAGMCLWIQPCGCACLGDPVCDSVTNVLDVVTAVDVAFRSAPAVTDPLCPNEQTDVSCDGVTNVIDVVKFVNVAFRSGDPAAEFCEPCP